MIPSAIFLSARSLERALALLMILLACAVATHAQAGHLNLEAVGSARIIGEDVSAARTQAITHALTTAVSEALSELLPLETRVKNFQTINETIYRRLEAYIQEYKVLAEFSGEKAYRVMVQATINADGLNADISTTGIRLAPAQLPRLAFFISQNTIQDPLARYGWQAENGFQMTVSESMLRGQMEKDGFPAVSFQELAAYIMQNLSESTSPISAQDAVAAGRALKADVVIIGNAIVSKTSSTMGESIQTYKADFQVQAFRVETAEPIGRGARNLVVAAEEESAGIAQALNAVAALLGQDLAGQLRSSWRPAEEKPKSIEILIEGDSFMSRFVKFRLALGRIAGIEDIQIQEMRASSAHLIVDFAKDAQSLANALLLSPFDDFGLKIDASAPNILKIQLVSAVPSQQTDSP